MKPGLAWEAVMVPSYSPPALQQARRGVERNVDWEGVGTELITFQSNKSTLTDRAQLRVLSTKAGYTLVLETTEH